MKQKDRLNEMVRRFYTIQGYRVKEGYDFSKAHHPQEQAMWSMAIMSFNYWSQVLKEKKE